jgi:hypothetical protein
MKKRRPAIPGKVREAVLREFNHLCALCGDVKPHLHHIDEDPSNNDPENLLPLCPNHHIIDQHNPTARVHPVKLRLFRRHKDPVILGPQFEPLFRRFAFVLTLGDDAPFQGTVAQIHDLGRFTKVLKMGDYYSTCIVELLQWIDAPLTTGEVLYAREEAEEHRRSTLVATVRRNAEKIESLVVEMIRYQDWQPPDFGAKSKARS